jgi:hypothetical protein
MFMVVLSTFEWSSFRIIFQIPKSDGMVLLLTSVLTASMNLAVALVGGERLHSERNPIVGHASRNPYCQVVLCALP